VTADRYTPPLLLQQPADATPLTQFLTACTLPKDRRTPSLLPPCSSSLLSACAAALAPHASLAAYVAAAHPSLFRDGGGGSSALESFTRDCKQLTKEVAAADASVTNSIRCTLVCCSHRPFVLRCAAHNPVAGPSERKCGARCRPLSLERSRCQWTIRLRKRTILRLVCSSCRYPACLSTVVVVVVARFHFDAPLLLHHSFMLALLCLPLPLYPPPFLTFPPPPPFPPIPLSATLRPAAEIEI
jgi:hypothetical protein